MRAKYSEEHSPGYSEPVIHEIDGPWKTTLSIVEMDKPWPADRLFPYTYELYIPTYPARFTERTGSKNKKCFDHKKGSTCFNLPATEFVVEWEGKVAGISFIWDSSVIANATTRYFGQQMSQLHWRSALSDYAPAIAYLGIDIGAQVVEGYPAGKEHVYRMLESLISMCIRRYSTTNHKDDVVSKVYSKQILTAINFISLHLHENLSVDEISYQSSSSKAHLNRLFWAEVGMSVWSYVAQQRVFRAAHKLSSSNDEIGEIARKLGFKSRSNFIAQFKKIYDCTPSHYRRQNKIKS